MNERTQTDPLAALQPLLDDPDVLEILVDGAKHVYVENVKPLGGLVDVPTPFRDEAHLREVIDAIFTPLGGKVDVSHPWGDGRLPDGSRVNVVAPPISLTGPVMTIRKFPSWRLTLEEAVRFRSLSEEMVQFLRACIAGRLSIVVAGGTGSGKTTFMNIIAGMIPARERIITIEAVDELRLPDTLKRVVRLVSRPPDAEGKGAVTVRDLVINSMRMRPDRIVVGEVWGGEALDVLRAMNTGHEGSMMIVHAKGPRDALARLEMMVLMANPALPLLNVRQQMASAVDLITYQERLRDGTRKLMKVTEVVGMQGDVIELQDIFEFRETGVDEEGRITGDFVTTGYVPSFLERIKATGVELPAGLFEPA